jgi:hypothetical protein
MVVAVCSKRSKRQCDLRDVRVEIELAASGRRFTFEAVATDVMLSILRPFRLRRLVNECYDRHRNRVVGSSVQRRC